MSSEVVYCKCGKEATIRTSYTSRNSSRRYYSCAAKDEGLKFLRDSVMFSYGVFSQRDAEMFSYGVFSQRDAEMFSYGVFSQRDAEMFSYGVFSQRDAEMFSYGVFYMHVVNAYND
ncbi:hypothetical protein QVD17_30110 [Tagetes erecta]|uniref:GRF-type domain-containing protein n=1 Tax=Tagetes erecta TaxID=13708 RepID=A0AAD8K3K8_TARER|nr:hypothetical protein QVD17_30110 [Tagetes erecta]